MKSKRIFGLISALLLSMIAAGGLFAQVDLPGNSSSSIFNSPQSTATLGRIRSDADNVMRADAYSKPEKWYGYVSYAAANKAALGFATGIGNAFLGVHYYGNFWSGLAHNNFTEEDVDYFGSNKGSYPVYGSTPSVPLPADLTTENTVAVLIGVANMGFRLGFNSTHQFFKKDDIAVNNPAYDPGDPSFGPEHYFYKNYKTEAGWIRPQIVWAMAKDLTKVGLKPYVGFNLEFYRDNLESETYTAANTTSRRSVARSQNYLSPLITLGTGGITVFKKNEFSLSADLEYQIRLRAYNNDYNYIDGSGNVQQKSIKGNNSGSALTELSYINNYIIPTLAGSWNKDNLRLRFRFQPRMYIISEGVTPMVISAGSTNGLLVKQGDETDTFTFEFNPRLQLAAQWWIIPKLALNAGGQITTNALTLKTVNSQTFNNNTLTPGSGKTQKNTTFGNTQSSLLIGFTIKATDNLGFEVSTGVNVANNNKVNVVEDLLNFSSLMVSLKF